MNDSTQTMVKDSTHERGSRPDPVRLAGYIRQPQPRGVRKQPKGVRRLYRTPTSKTYVDIKLTDILNLPRGDIRLAPGQTAIWVRPEAEWTVTIGPHESRPAGRPSWPRR